ncbi:hypothetical protein V8E53_003798 [Lactarius tabidus]
MQPSVAVTLAAPAWVAKLFKLDHIQQLVKLFLSPNTSMSTFTQYRDVQSGCESAAGMRNEDEADLEDLAGAGEAPVDSREERVLETGKLGAQGPRRAQRVAMWHGGEDDGEDDSPVHGRENVVKVGWRTQI